METTYKIVRFYFGGGNKVIKKGLSLREAQLHCHNPETSSATAKEGIGEEPCEWFDGYTREY